MKLQILFCFVAAAGCAVGDDVQSYSVPKDHPAIGAVESVQTASPVRWTVPADWKELPGNSIRIGSFLVTGKDDKKAEVAVTSFPGEVGTELDNVLRWRREIGLAAVDKTEVASEKVTVDSVDGKIYDLSSPTQRTVVVSVPRDGATWFFKLRGDADVVAAAKPVFLDFLKTVHFQGAAPDTAVITAPPTATTVDSQEATPATWTPTTPGPMVLKSYSIGTEAGAQAAVTISSFPGDVGGTLANVNRWRRQMGLATVTEDDLPMATQPLDVGGGKGTVVDFTGTAGKSAKRARLVAVIVPQADSTWFFKLVGDEPVVAREKAAFVKFVQNARFP